MSDTHTASNARQGRKHQDAPQAAEGAAAPQAHATPIVTIEIGGMQISLPVKFLPGHVLTENQAKILDAAYQRQFTNNQNANIKARAERLTKATTDAERAANAPQTATDIAAIYMDYEPAVGGTPRQSALEKLRQETAWDFWTGTVAEHNKQIAAGGQGIIAKAPGKPASLKVRPRLAKGGDKAAHEVAVAAYEAWQTETVGKLLAHSAYGPQIEALVTAKLEAAKAAKAAEASAAPAAGVEAVEADSLF